MEWWMVGGVGTAIPLIAAAIRSLFRWLIMVGGREISRVLGIHITSQVQPQFDRIWSELRPNGGTSLRDAVDRIEVRLTHVEQMAEEDHP